VSTKPAAGQFEELIAWQKARALTKAIFQATKPGEFSKNYSLVSQIQRAAVSIVANIAEGFEPNRRTEFHQFLSIAKSSSAEVRSHLYVALDVGYLKPQAFQLLHDQADEVGRILGGLRQTVAKQRGEALRGPEALSKKH